MDYIVLDSNASTGDLGLRFRQSKSGPEQELVHRFLENFTLDIPRGFKVTVFKEPRIESGFPDLVLVVWKNKITERWNLNRLLLQPSDIKVMHYITQIKNTKTTELEIIFGSKVKKSLSKLADAEMIHLSGDYLAAGPLSKLYATKHIIAIEAKMTGRREALDQAFRNLWFATASYILLPQIPRVADLFTEANSLGVGIWSMESPTLDIRSLPFFEPSPISYVSWLFNEWAWRASKNSIRHHFH
jgi:hypothetical protein